jgi:hypothetical protein
LAQLAQQEFEALARIYSFCADLSPSLLEPRDFFLTTNMPNPFDAAILDRVHLKLAMPFDLLTLAM